MSNLFNNKIVQGVFVTLIGVFILGLFGWLKFRRDEKIVASFLKDSGVDAGHTFSTTQAISSATNLGENRIRKICSKSSRIRRNREEEESWKLSD